MARNPDSHARAPAGAAGGPPAAEGRGSVAVWLCVSAASRPRRMAHFLGELAEPDFVLDSCRESARLAGDPGRDYCAHWYCRFAPAARDAFASVRLMKRLTGAGFDILRYDASADGPPPLRTS